MWRALMVLGVLGGTAMAAPPESSPFGAHSIVVPAKKLAFVMTDEGSGKVPVARGARQNAPMLVAIDLTTGKRRWTSKVAVKPIAVRGNSLVALDGAGNAFVLDVRTGAKAKGCNTLPNVKAPFVDGLGVYQSAHGYDDGTSIYLVASRDTFYSGGAAPSPDEEARARSRSNSTLAIDLATCSTKAANLTLASTALGDGISDIVTPKGNTARIARNAKTGTITLTPASGAKTSIDLTEGDPKRTAVHVSIDRRYVACGDPFAQKAAVFDLETGAVSHPAYFDIGMPWLNFGKTIIVGAGFVGALDATSGTLLWSVAERSTAYNGPYPPSAAP